MVEEQDQANLGVAVRARGPVLRVIAEPDPEIDDKAEGEFFVLGFRGDDVRRIQRERPGLIAQEAQSFTGL